jgi:hypothetical protein
MKINPIRTPLMGLVTNGSKLPRLINSARLKFSSSIGPRIKPNSIGAGSQVTNAGNTSALAGFNAVKMTEGLDFYERLLGFRLPLPEQGVGLIVGDAEKPGGEPRRIFQLA